MKRIVVLALFALSACASRPVEPVVKVVTVNMPVPVSCVPDGIPAKPAKDPPTRSELLAAQDAAARYQLLAGFWSDWSPRIILDEATLAACKAVGRPKP